MNFRKTDFHDIKLTKIIICRMIKIEIAIQYFLESLYAERHAAKNTLEAYTRDLNFFKKWMMDQSLDNDLTRVTEKTAIEYQNFVQNQPVSRSTMARRVVVVRQLFAYHFVNGILIKNAFEDISPVSPRHKQILGLTEQHIHNMIKTLSNSHNPEDIRLYFIVAMLFMTGLRVTELVTLKLNDVLRIIEDKNSNGLFSIVGKGQKERLICMSQRLQEIFQKYMSVRSHFCKNHQDNIYLFCTQSQHGFLTRQQVGRILKKLATSVGLNTEIISPHLLRHAFATHLLEHDVDMLSLKTALGHNSIATTQKYTHMMHNNVIHLVEKYHPISRETEED